MNVTGNISTLVPQTLDGPYIAAELVIATLSISGNVMVCLAVGRNRRLQTVTNYFLVSLAIADFFVGALAIPCAIMTNLGIPHHDLYLCILMLSVLIMLTQSSIFSLLAVAVERYFAILLPFHYQRIMEPCNAKLVILVTWVLALLMGTVPLMGWHKTPPQPSHCFFTSYMDLTYMVYFNFLGGVLVPLLVMFVMYTHIFMTVKRQVRRISAVHFAGEVHARPTAGARREVKKANSLFLLVFLFAICWIPVQMVNCCLLMCPHCAIPPPLSQTTIILSHAHSAVNPFLYAYRMKSFRRAFKAIFLCRRITAEPESSKGDGGTTAKET